MRLVITSPGERSFLHARDDDVECREHVRGLIEGSILVDVNFDAAEDTKWWRSGLCFSGKLIVDALDLFELSDEALSGESRWQR
jgi:hypothetical protein